MEQVAERLRSGPEASCSQPLQPSSETLHWRDTVSAAQRSQPGQILTDSFGYGACLACAVLTWCYRHSKTQLLLANRTVAKRQPENGAVPTSNFANA